MNTSHTIKTLYSICQSLEDKGEPNKSLIIDELNSLLITDPISGSIEAKTFIHDAINALYQKTFNPYWVTGPLLLICALLKSNSEEKELSMKPLSDLPNGDVPLSSQEAAEYLPFSASWLEKSRMTNTGPKHISIGRRIFYKPSSIKEWLTKQLDLSED